MGINADFRDTMQELAVQHSMCSISDCCFDFTKVIEEFFA